MLSVQTMTTQQFEVYAALPENAGKRLELIGGQVYGDEDGEPMVSSTLASEIALLIAAAIIAYLQNHAEAPRGRVTGADGGYHIGADRVIPDVGFYRTERLPERPTSGYLPIAPDLAVEVTSPTDKPGQVVRKIGLYNAAGVVVWQVYPEEQIVEVHIAQQPVIRLGAADTLSGEPVLPGFRLPLARIWEIS